MLSALLALLFAAPVRPQPPAVDRAGFLLVLERPDPVRLVASYDLEAALVDLDENGRPTC